ncbi:MAG: efflux RND transporter periplasmic adaptor subunit [Gammaproteobacteria bacterium]|nr:efflux RND transporter periplasmic adaptor subunit [Gammaproteobacteria bacterium]
MRRKLFIVIILLCAAIFSAIFLLKDSKHKQGLIKSSVAKQSFIIAKKELIPNYYRVSGTVEPNTTGKLAAQIVGKIDNVFVKNGDNVKKGELLIKIDSRDYVAKLAAAKQAVEAAKALFAEQKNNIKRMQNMLKKSYISHSLYDQSLAAFLQSKANLLGAEKVYDQAKVALSYCKITAPANGVILSRNVDPSDQASPGKILLTIQTSTLLHMAVNVPAMFMHKLKLGDVINLEVNGKNLLGKVSEIAPNIDSDSRTFLMKIAIRAKEGDLFSGSYGYADLPIGERQAVVIPTKAVVTVGQLELVKIIHNGDIIRTFITTGQAVDGDKIEVLSGLEGGEKVLV